MDTPPTQLPLPTFISSTSLDNNVAPLVQIDLVEPRDEVSVHNYLYHFQEDDLRGPPLILSQSPPGEREPYFDSYPVISDSTDGSSNEDGDAEDVANMLIYTADEGVSTQDHLAANVSRLSLERANSAPANSQNREMPTLAQNIFSVPPHAMGPCSNDLHTILGFDVPAPLVLPISGSFSVANFAEDVIPPSLTSILEENNDAAALPLSSDTDSD
ncbi:hypothetical protein CPB83DRAFT_896596 [Crepidotus variabilis]|uniref:Uncharacterized protein n=1 Tax=Crepidotus variabilis TaxID=179855 RepID=A0A9P6EBG7_9AGAR|nr:hypothetical protein CPB83DRAFT_896596 [Crepidotus variabilis]